MHVTFVLTRVVQKYNKELEMGKDVRGGHAAHCISMASCLRLTILAPVGFFAFASEWKMFDPILQKYEPEKKI